MDEGMLYLVISLALIASVLGGYAWYLGHRGLAARRSLDTARWTGGSGSNSNGQTSNLNARG